MIKPLIITILTITGCTSAFAQNLDRQMEVTREYTPRIDRATKLAALPDMTDTVRLRPIVAYQINSVASETSFAVKPYEPAATRTSPGGDSGSPFYLRGGLGWPIVTDFDLYFTPAMRAGSSFGAFVNHDGSYSKIRNNLGIKTNATQMANGIGTWFGKTWNLKSLDIDASYDSRLYNPYGMAGENHPVDETTEYQKVMNRFSLGLARVGVSFGDNFSDLSRLNFRIAMEGGYAHGNDKKQSKYDIKISLAKMLGQEWGFEFALEDKWIFPSKIKGNAMTLSVLPRIIYLNGRFGLKLGVDAHYIRNSAWSDQRRFLITPMFDARINLANGVFVPFASFTAHTLDGDYEALTRRNPYIVTGGPTGRVSDGRVGVRGDLNDKFTYKAFVGVSFFRDYQIFTGVPVPRRREATPVSYPAMWFAPVGVDGSRWTAGIDLSVRKLAGFGARAYGNWNEFHFSGGGNFSPVGDLPDYDAGIELSWAYKSDFSIRAGVEFIGERDYLVRNSGTAAEPYSTGVIAPVMDVKLGVEVRVKPQMWIFVDCENLANQRLYPYPHYRGLGTCVMGGVKILF